MDKWKFFPIPLLSLISSSPIHKSPASTLLTSIQANPSRPLFKFPKISTSRYFKILNNNGLPSIKAKKNSPSPRILQFPRILRRQPPGASKYPKRVKKRNDDRFQSQTVLHNPPTARKIRASNPRYRLSNRRDNKKISISRRTERNPQNIIRPLPIQIPRRRHNKQDNQSNELLFLTKRRFHIQPS